MKAAHTLLALLLLVVLTGEVMAEAGDKQQQVSRAAFDQGITLYERGDYVAALSKFEEAHRTFPNPLIQLNIGLCKEKLGQFAGAANHFEAFLEASGAAAFPRRRAAVRKKLDRLRGRLGNVTLRCPHSGATVELDGQGVGLTPLPHRLYVDPGSHWISVKKDGFSLFKRDLVLAAGEHQQIKVELEPHKTSPVPAAALPRPVKRPLPPGPEVSEPFYKKWWFWTAVGAVVLGSAAASVAATQTGGSDRLPQEELFREPLK